MSHIIQDDEVKAKWKTKVQAVICEGTKELC